MFFRLAWMRGIPREFVALLALLAAMVALMWQPMREEAATFDEPLFLAAGCTYLKGMGWHIDPEQPPLAKEWSALPLLFMDVKISERAGRYLDPQWGDPETRTWGDQRIPVQSLFPLGRDSWYFRPMAEGNAFGNLFLYDGTNDAEKLLFAGRLMQVVLTLLTGAVIFFWVRQLAGGKAAVLGAALWVFNPIALAYGHLVLTDMGVTLTMLLGVWSFSKLLEKPTSSRAVLVGLATGGALLMKFTAVLLAPMYATMAVVWWWKSPPERQRWGTICKVFALAGLVTWITILLGYAPYWSPAPSLPAEQATRMGVPWWFQQFRFCLIPPDFFKGLACQIGHTHVGHWAYLCGQWRRTGWWYYYPVALALKAPIPWLIMLLVGLFLGLKTAWRGLPMSYAPWIAAVVYLGFAMSSSIDNGVRHLLPMIALLTVGIAALIGSQPRTVRMGAWLLCGWLVAMAAPWIGAVVYRHLATSSSINVFGIRHLVPMIALLAVGIAALVGSQPRTVRIGAWLLCGWLAGTALLAHPDYLKYFNEFAGGKRNGYRYLLDSNLDWGQDVKPLRKFLEDHHIGHIYQDYVGKDVVLDYYKISNTRVSADQARELQQGILVVSVHEVMGPDWNWLRESHHALACVADTFFVYDLTPAATTP
jgi:4-amino-4-deoxy-L-arabinose transferase-like glycosyltransferase